MLHLLVFLIIGGIAGWLAGKIVSGHGYGIIGDVVIGVIGGFIGGFIWRDLLKLTIVNRYEEFLVALIGAIILVALVHLVRREPTRL